MALIGVKTCQNKRICLEKSVKNERIDTFIRDSRVDKSRISRGHVKTLTPARHYQANINAWTYTIREFPSTLGSK